MISRIRSGVSTLALAAAGALALMIGGGAAEAQTLRVASSDFSPQRGVPASGARQNLYAMETLYDGLTTVDGKGVAQPRLALSWAITDDQKVWRFNLRRNVTFHNGQPLNADAIVATVNYLLSDDGKRVMGGIFSNLRTLAGARKVDDHTVEILTHAPDPILPNQIAALYVIEHKAYAEMGTGAFGLKPVGTGSFQAVSWGDNEIDMKRYDKAWNPPKVEGIKLVSIPEVPSRALAVSSGQVDIALTLNKDDRAQIERAGAKMYAEYAPSVNIIVLNTARQEQLKDKRVRQAFNYALDKNFAKALFGDGAKASGQPAASTVRGYQDDIKPYAFDVAKAKALMAEAGYPNGFSMVAEAQGNVGTKEAYEFAAQSLQAIGVTMELRVVTTADLIARINGAKPWEGGAFGMNFGAAPIGDVMRPVNSYHSCAHPQKWTCYPDMEPLRQMINTEFDAKKRDAGLRQLAQRYHEDPPVIYLEETVAYHAHSAKVGGFKSENFLIPWASVTLAR